MEGRICKGSGEELWEDSYWGGDTSHIKMETLRRDEEEKVEEDKEEAKEEQVTFETFKHNEEKFLPELSLTEV
jgi:hypothetical protein